jgi:glycine/D-amino acid oxidase-like deaminating enzyme
MLRPPAFPVFFADQYYGLPAVGIDGVKVSHKNLWDPVDPDSANRSVSLEFIESARTLCSRFIPELADAGVVQAKVCLYDMTKNSDFVVGPDPKDPSVVYAYGFSGHGFKFAPLVGKILAGLALGKPASFDLERFSPANPHDSSVSGPPY